jgi:hypothetical protein
MAWGGAAAAAGPHWGASMGRDSRWRSSTTFIVSQRGSIGPRFVCSLVFTRSQPTQARTSPEPLTSVSHRLHRMSKATSKEAWRHAAQPAPGRGRAPAERPRMPTKWNDYRGEKCRD